MQKQHSCRAFTLLELIVVVSVIALLVALLLPAIASTRRLGKQVTCSNSLRQTGVEAMSYSVDFRDAIFGFSWNFLTAPPSDLDDDLLAQFRAGVAQERYQTLHSAQANYLFRRAENASASTMPLLGTFLTGLRYSSVVLDSYADRSINSSLIRSCPEDRVRLSWRDISKFEADMATDFDDANFDVASRYRFRFSSSYQMTFAAFAADSAPDSIIPATSHYFYPSLITSRMRLGGRRTAEIAFPSSKVWLYDDQDRHSSNIQMWFGERAASQPLLFFDGSVSMRKTLDANPGWHPQFPQAVPPPTVDKFSSAIFDYTVRIRYRPRPILGEAPARRDPASYPPFYMFTRAGLKGIDFGAPDINTSAWMHP